METGRSPSIYRNGPCVYYAFIGRQRLCMPKSRNAKMKGEIGIDEEISLLLGVIASWFGRHGIVACASPPPLGSPPSFLLPQISHGLFKSRHQPTRRNANCFLTMPSYPTAARRPLPRLRFSHQGRVALLSVGHCNPLACEDQSSG